MHMSFYQSLQMDPSVLKKELCNVRQYGKRPFIGLQWQYALC